jgi:predicted outer membrane protein
MPRIPLFIISALCVSSAMLRGDDASALSQTDLAFAKQAISIDKAEIRMARIAANRHLMAPLQSLADSMVTYHSATLKQLLSWSRAENAGLADEIQPDDLMTVDALNGLSDSEVPERFIKMHIECLKRTLDLYATEINDGNDRALKAIAGTVLAQVRLDLDSAQVLESRH